MFFAARKRNPTEEKLISSLLTDYDRQVADLIKTGLTNGRMFSRKQISAVLTSSVLAKALKIIELGGQPKGLLMPDIDRYAKLYVLNAHKVYFQQGQIICDYLDDKGIWNGGRYFWPNSKTWFWSNKKWSYAIVDAIPNVPNDPKIKGGLIYDEEIAGEKYERAKAWTQKYIRAGLDVMIGIDPYLSLVRQCLVEGQVIDTETYTALNNRDCEGIPSGEAKVSDKREFYEASGHWEKGKLHLRHTSRKALASQLRMRAMISVL